MQGGDIGLNPSGVEFPERDRFRRFGKARNPDPRMPDAHFRGAYLEALHGYFKSPPNDPYTGWFGGLKPLLEGLGCSYDGAATNTALHTDICSPLATNPTWSKLSPEVQSRLMQSGTPLWHGLIDWLSPDVILASVARSHLDRISFAREGRWHTVHTVQRKNPYHVEVMALRLPNGKTTRLVFGKAANKPFGTVSSEDKRRIGAALKAYITQH